MDEDQQQSITFRVVLEVLGKPEKHVEQAIAGYVKNIEDDENFTIKKKQTAEIKKREEEEMFSIFAELEISTNDIKHLTYFGFQYMPSIIEILEPKTLTLSDTMYSEYLNDLQTRLHQVDLVAKRLKFEKDSLKKNSKALLKNYITVLLKQAPRTIDELAVLTGIEDKNNLGDFLDNLLDAGQIDLKDTKYFLTKKE